MLTFPHNYFDFATNSSDASKHREELDRNDMNHYVSREQQSVLRGLAGTLPNEYGPRAMRGENYVHNYHLEDDTDTENNFATYAKKHQGNAVDRRDFSELKAMISFDPHNSKKLRVDHIEEVAFVSGGESEYTQMNDTIRGNNTRGSRTTGPFIRPMEVGTRGGTIRSHAPGTSTHRVNPETDGHNADIFSAQLKLDNRHKVPLFPSVDGWHGRSGEGDIDDDEAGGLHGLGGRSRIPVHHQMRNGAMPSISAGSDHPIFKSKDKAKVIDTLSRTTNVLEDEYFRDGALLDAPSRVGATHLRYSGMDESRTVQGILPTETFEHDPLLRGSNYEYSDEAIRRNKPRDSNRFSTNMDSGNSAWMSLHMQ